MADKEEMIKAIKGVLLDHGIDWIMNERQPADILNKPFDDVMEEIRLATKKYKVV